MPRRFQTLDEVSSLGSADDTLVLVGEGSNADKKVSATTLKLVSIQTVSQTGHGFTLTASLPKPVFLTHQPQSKSLRRISIHKANQLSPSTLT